ncbi:hypothetical protein CASFOL_034002 [Castilleja foliolosa]|uniref:Transposase-associated domain-containing protein n=1 Tax=Castilleja foliolosa TaxID=1961234 RepID=A0ABD3BZQ2_9LAMI
MDRSWINKNRTSVEYENGVEEFLKFASSRVSASNGDGRYYCPCVKCLNDKLFFVREIREHVICDGFNKKYTRWIWHDMHDEEVSDNLEEMINDIGAEAFEQGHGNRSYTTLSANADKSLYPGCKNYSRLSATLKLISLKATHGWSDRSFTDLLVLLKGMIPENNELPDSNYAAKKILCPLGLAKILWYLPVIPRFKRLFASPVEAKNLRWHVDEKIDDGQLRHPADSPQWKKMDQLYPSFGNEPRNLRLGLCTDGMNPYGNFCSQHSAWPVLLVIYNLSPLLSMKRKYIMLSMMISGPKQPGNDIDVYLQPLIEDLQKLFVEGVDVFDAYKMEIFRMRAMLFCTINYFPAYGNLSWYSNKGHKACPKCGDRTCYHQLQFGRKTVYLGHRKWLKPGHPYRKLMKAFNGRQEDDLAPAALTPEQVYDQVKQINTTFGKTQQRGEKSLWKKRSVFFKLPYWKFLDVKHCIVSLTRAYVSINQMDIMGLLAAGTVSVPVMKFYNKCLYNVLVSSGRADKYGLMCPLAIQSHGNNEEMGLIRNRIGEGGFDCFLLPFYDKGWELMALCPKSGCIASTIETYQVVKGMRSNTLSKPKWVYPKCCNKDVVDPECGLFVMRHMLELIKLDVVNSFEEVLHMDKPYSSDDIDDVRRSWAKCFLDNIR